MNQLVRAIHASSAKLAIACAGGGSGAIAALAREPGASRTLLVARVPYSEGALAAYLGRKPERFCSAETAMDLALRALDEALSLAGGSGQRLLGVGVSGCLATDRPRRGEEKCHVALIGDVFQIVRTIEFRKGDRDRREQEDVTDALILNCVAEACGLHDRVPLDLAPGEAAVEAELASEFWYSRLVSSAIGWFCRNDRGRLSAFAPPPVALLPGAFNPFHEGHRWLIEAASRIVGGRVDCEISILNVDKPPVEADDLARRLQKFPSPARVFVTRAPTFLEKARLFPACVFVIGADTAPRVVAPRYYDGSDKAMLAALDEIARLGCRFLVAGRVDATGRFVTLDDVEAPAQYRRLFQAIPASDFRMDISSTELRKRGK